MSKNKDYSPKNIVKALRICRRDSGCTGCPLRGYKFCVGNMKKTAADLIEEQQREIERLREELRWIPVSGQDLPKEFVSVLVCIPSENPLPTVKEAYLADGMWITKAAYYTQQEVTHWRPMPKGVEVKNDAV